MLWVFGYGSLIWNPGFQYQDRMVGYILDYERVFDIACYHRGTKDIPARMCNIQPKAGAICWGAAYSIAGGDEEENKAIEYLEKRECEYDTKTYLHFYSMQEEEGFVRRVKVLVFMSGANRGLNRYYIGEAPLDKAAMQIAVAVGPCGSNRDYLFMLEKTLDEMGHPDCAIVELANKVREVLRWMSPLDGLCQHLSPKHETQVARINGLGTPSTKRVSKHALIGYEGNTP